MNSEGAGYAGGTGLYAGLAATVVRTGRILIIKTTIILYVVLRILCVLYM